MLAQDPVAPHDFLTSSFPIDFPVDSVEATGKWCDNQLHLFQGKFPLEFAAALYSNVTPFLLSQACSKTTRTWKKTSVRKAELQHTFPERIMRASRYAIPQFLQSTN